MSNQIKVKILTKDPSASYKSRDRGSAEFESRLHEKEGEIMKIANKDVITISPSLPIKDASEKMVDKGIRRLPVTDPGSNKLKGMLITRDIVDFLGGGEKHKIIENKHSGKFLSAINDSVKIIMETDPPYADDKASISEVAKILKEKGVGGVPIINKEEKVVGIASERDLARYMPSPAKARVGTYMSQNIVTVNPSIYLIDAMKKMISEGFRRLPVIENGNLLGIITSVDVLEYFGTSEMFNHMSSGDALDAMHIEIEKLMTKTPITVTPGDDVGETARKMEENGYGGLPVLEDEKLVGIITERDIVEALL